jgi:hypothetical protein|tara:strand:+ start:182 stop:700 length:519 start_codon:yes stop_codon:yes gene_type:complete
MKGVLNTLGKTIGTIGNKFVDRFRKELSQQNHNASGTLSNTMHFTVKSKKDELDLIIQSKADYIRQVNEGQRPFDWDLSEILDWMDDKDKNGNNKKFPDNPNERKRMAINIAKKISQEGTPTRNSKQYSNNTFRRGFINRVVGSNERHFFNDIHKAVSKDVDIILKRLPKQI